MSSIPTRMTTPEGLAAATSDQLATMYGILNARAVAADRRSVACSRAMALRDRVAEEVSRRGLLIRPSYLPGTYNVGTLAEVSPS